MVTHRTFAAESLDCDTAMSFHRELPPIVVSRTLLMLDLLIECASNKHIITSSILPFSAVFWETFRPPVRGHHRTG
jgi:hypothetical protein